MRRWRAGFGCARAAFAASALFLTVAVIPGEAQQPGAVRIPASVLRKYVGEYNQNGNVFKVTVRGDTLFREASGRRVILTPISETLFRSGGVFTAEFVGDERGNMTMVVASGVLEWRIPRKGSRPVPPPPVSAVRVERSVLERYVGTYEYIPGQMSRGDLRVMIRLEGNTLIRSVPRLPDAVLTPLSETRFIVAGTSREVEFVVDDAGVTQIMGPGGQQLLARLTSR